jgi:hypothetical protein
MLHNMVLLLKVSSLLKKRGSQPVFYVNIYLYFIVCLQGNGYDASTGYFTVPRNGTYMFIATAGPTSVTNRQTSTASHNLMVDGAVISQASTTLYSTHASYSDSYSNSGLTQASVHGIAHLQVGQNVSVQGSGNINTAYSSFSGFLLSPDL